MKILAITGIRSDYDLLSSLYFLFEKDKDIELKLLVGGAHLSSSYGSSVKQIEDDGLDILLKIESLIDSDSKQSRLKSASIFLQNSIDIVAQYTPDLIIYAGDREDVIIGGLLGGYLEIPTIHFYAGDHSQDGHIDNPVRHATSKLSTMQFVSIEKHRKRLIKIGENPDRIKIIGSIALDRFYNTPSMEKEKIKEYFKIKDGFDNYGLVIYHPVVEEKVECHRYFENILKSLAYHKINAFISYPNTDPGNRSIINVVNKYKDDPNFIFYKNLDRDLFINLFKNSRIMVGNSSAGILEAASIPIPVINVGQRQLGRTSSGNVIFCDTDYNSINDSIMSGLSAIFQTQLNTVVNIYGDGNSAQKAYKLIKEIDFNKLLLKREDPLEMAHE
jgi:GDP/UDP-N,N'-diacetylbacillosamine 2-epimerase (hydrolysing)